MVLSGSRFDVVRNAVGDPIQKKFVPAKKIVFQNGIGITTDPDVVELVRAHSEWGHEITWHPTCAPKEELTEVVPLADSIEKDLAARNERKVKGIQNAMEGGIPRE